MAQKNHTTNLTELLLQCVAQPDPMLSMLEWLCAQLMEAEVSQQLGADAGTNCRCTQRGAEAGHPAIRHGRGGTLGKTVPHWH